MSDQTSNVEFAYKINEQGHSRRSKTDRRHRGIEIAEALALATVAIATAWTGYQAARWEALSARNNALASETNVVAQKECHTRRLKIYRTHRCSLTSSSRLGSTEGALGPKPLVSRRWWGTDTAIRQPQDAHYLPM